MRRLIVALTLLAPLLPAADEGMWTFDAFPSEKVQRAYGFAPTPAWLENVRLSSARLARGCSGSFVSGQGLVMTNHHCAHSCIEQLSRAGKDFVKDGFYAKTAADEPKCPDVEVNQLVGIADVTARVRAATKGLEGEAYEKAQRGEMAKIEKECQTSDALRCDVVTLYQGGLYHLYTYRRFQDVRLVYSEPRVKPLSLAVTTTTGMVCSSGSLFIRCSTCSPFILGNFKSSRMTLGRVPVERASYFPRRSRKSRASAPSCT